MNIKYTHRLNDGKKFSSFFFFFLLCSPLLLILYFFGRSNSVYLCMYMYTYGYTVYVSVFDYGRVYACADGINITDDDCGGALVDG